MNRTLAADESAAHVRVIGFLSLCLLPMVVAFGLTRELAGLVISNESFSQILLLPFVSLFLIYENRRRIFSEVSAGWIYGIVLIIPGFVCVGAARFNIWHLSGTNPDALFVFGIVLIWLGAFGLCFGAHAFRVGRFPLLFLLFSVPIPEPIHSYVVAFLQEESADAAELCFRLANVPYLRRDLVFELPGVAIRVAEQCSGIRSSLALLITGVLASYLFLGSTWRRLILCVVLVPLAIMKNGLRIATLSTLAIYVDPEFLRGDLHHRGGIVFFAVALIPMAALLVLLRNGENPNRGLRWIPSPHPRNRTPISS